jgi:glycosyltransferase involved in cell wall biosynthesis
MKVLFITNIISPYRIPLWNYLNQVADFDFKVVALAEKEANREWRVAKEQIKFDYRILPGFHRFIRTKEVPLHLNRGLWRALRQYKPDIIITSGYDAPAYWQALLYCKFFKKKYILWNGTTLLSVGTTGGLVGRMKRVIIKGADRYIAYGMKAAEYLVHMGAPEGHIHVGVNTVDMDWFREQVAEFRQDKTLLRERTSYPTLLLLYVGQLIGRKGVSQVLKALDELHDPDIGLLIVGSGPQEEELRQFCGDQGLKNIYFEGFQQQKALPRYYALADVLVLPSFEEVWGLVVNEALASGLYVLCSDRAGTAYDLIKEGWNGTLCDPSNAGELALLIKQVKERIGEICVRREAISEQACREFSIVRSAKAFLEAVSSLW